MSTSKRDSQFLVVTLNKLFSGRWLCMGQFMLMIWCHCTLSLFSYGGLATHACTQLYIKIIIAWHVPIFFSADWLLWKEEEELSQDYFSLSSTSFFNFHQSSSFLFLQHNQESHAFIFFPLLLLLKAIVFFLVFFIRCSLYSRVSFFLPFTSYRSSHVSRPKVATMWARKKERIWKKEKWASWPKSFSLSPYSSLISIIIVVVTIISRRRKEL